MAGENLDKGDLTLRRDLVGYVGWNTKVRAVLPPIMRNCVITLVAVLYGVASCWWTPIERWAGERSVLSVSNILGVSSRKANPETKKPVKAVNPTNMMVNTIVFRVSDGRCLPLVEVRLRRTYLCCPPRKSLFRIHSTAAEDSAMQALAAIASV